MVVQFVDGDVLFDNNVIAFHEDCCCPPPVPGCCTGDLPREISIDLSGIILFSVCPCSGFCCEDVVCGVSIFTFTPGNPFSANRNWKWFGPFINCDSGPRQITASLTLGCEFLPHLWDLRVFSGISRALVYASEEVDGPCIDGPVEMDFVRVTSVAEICNFTSWPPTMTAIPI